MPDFKVTVVAGGQTVVFKSNFPSPFRAFSKVAGLVKMKIKTKDIRQDGDGQSVTLSDGSTIHCVEV